MDSKRIINEIEDYGISQWYTSKGLWSVLENYDGTFNLTISEGTSLRTGKIIEEYSSILLPDIELMMGKW